jgi:hypothetical protein
MKRKPWIYPFLCIFLRDQKYIKGLKNQFFNFFILYLSLNNKMSLAIINTNTFDQDNYNLEEKTSTALDAQRRQIIKRKVLAIGKMSRSYTLLKEHPELIQQLKNISLNGKLPVGTLATGEQGIREGK